MKSIYFTLICLTSIYCSLAVNAADPGTVLLSNVTLIDRDDGAQDVIVNILLRDGSVEVVTKEEIPASEAEISVDAKNYVLMGKLSIGDVPSFVVVDEDPRQNYEVLLDTKTHVKFAVVHGEVVVNELTRLVGTTPDSENVSPQSGWLSYNPPPMVLPMDYHATKKWNQFETGPVSGVFTGAVLLDRQRWLTQDAESVEQVGALNEFDMGEIRALRVGFVGTLNFDNPWVYTIFASSNGFDKGFDTKIRDDLTLLDYRLDIPLSDEVTLSVGKQKEPISMERLTSLVYLPMQERSAAADALLPSRNNGLVLNGSGFNQRMTWAAGIFNNWIDSPVSFDETPTQVIGRVTFLPWSSDDESNLFHLGFGVRHTDGKQGGEYLTEPQFNQAPLYVDTGHISAENAWTYDLEASWRKGPLWLAAEYIYSDVESPELGDPNFDGFNITASWALSGEMRTYNKRSGTFRPLPIANSTSQGGWGAWELSTRWSTLDLNDGAIEGGEMDIFSLGLNWWLSQAWEFSANYQYIWLDRFGVDGSSSGFNVRLMLML